MHKGGGKLGISLKSSNSKWWTNTLLQPKKKRKRKTKNIYLQSIKINHYHPAFFLHSFFFFNLPKSLFTLFIHSLETTHSRVHHRCLLRPLKHSIWIHHTSWSWSSLAHLYPHGPYVFKPFTLKPHPKEKAKANDRGIELLLWDLKTRLKWSTCRSDWFWGEVEAILD